MKMQNAQTSQDSFEGKEKLENMPDSKLTTKWQYYHNVVLALYKGKINNKNRIEISEIGPNIYLIFDNEEQENFQ